MKKKLLFALIALSLTLVLLLTACTSYSFTLEEITKLLKVDYSEVPLNVTTTTDGITLNGVYTLTFEGDKTIVDYSFDKLNDLDINGDNANGYLTTGKGSAVVENGMVVEGSAAVELPQEVDFNGLSFKPAFFENYSMTGAKFEADVKAPKAFLGNYRLECRNMHVTVLYSKDALIKIAITYVSENGSDVSITYLFTK